MPGFMTGEWAAACADTFNRWPALDYRATKLKDFWDWIDMVRPNVNGRLALSVTDLRPTAGTASQPAAGSSTLGPDLEGDTLVLDFEKGAVIGARVTSRAEAEDTATFLLAGSYESWAAMLSGYDVGKTIMYRRLLLEKGDTLLFFQAAFFWTELLAAIQSVPVELPQATRAGR